MEIKMLRQAVLVALAVPLAALLLARDAGGWGAYHVGYTHVGYGGVQHYGRTVGYGAGGFYSGGRAYYDRFGGYHVGYGYGDRYGVYAPRYYGGYHYGGFGYGGVYRGYRAGYYRRW